jgi:hypothetical protein
LVEEEKGKVVPGMLVVEVEWWYHYHYAAE